MMLGRRSFMITGAAAAADFGSGGGSAWAAETPIRYPEPNIKVLDPRFQPYVLGNAAIERIAGGCRFTEGPVWFGDGRYLLWSDIPNDRILKWEEETGAISVFRRPSNYANGNTRDRQGRLVTCEHDARRVTRTEYDGTITVLIDKFDGKPLNSPNDVVVKSDGAIWFTDPTPGISGNYEGHVATQELPTNVYRLDPRTGRATVVVGNIRPNGLCFSPDERKMYIVDFSATPRLIRVYDVVDDGTKLANSRAFVTCEAEETPDGFRCDIDGNLWCGWGTAPALDGVVVFNPDGKRIGKIALPERSANLCFGGIKRNRLFMAASHSLYSLYVNTQGAVGG